MSFEDFEHLVYDFIGVPHMPYHDFKFIWRIYESWEREGFIDYEKFYRDLKAQMASGEGLRDGGQKYTASSFNKSRSPSKTLNKT